MLVILRNFHRVVTKKPLPALKPEAALSVCSSIRSAAHQGESDQYTSTPSMTTFRLSLPMEFLLAHRVEPVGLPLSFTS